MFICCCNLMFHDWNECAMSALGTTKHSLCNQCIDNNVTLYCSCIVDSMSLLQKVKSGMGSPDIHLRKLLWVYCHRVKGNDRADRLAGKGTIASGLLLRRSDVWRNSRHYLREQSQGRHTTDRLEERGMERESAR